MGADVGYLDDVVRFVEGVDWDFDEGGEVRRVAFWALGDHLADHPDTDLRSLLLRIAGDPAESSDRHSATRALATAVGVPADERLWLPKEIDDWPWGREICARAQGRL